tara:strand:+ start:119 stop:724 length:606 start_codon:yes stop_codon:yes gene_type:complete
MKKIFLPIGVLFFLSFIAITAKLTKEEREYGVKELIKSQAMVMDVVDGLSEEQFDYKISDSSWSISEITEHIAISENMMFNMLQEGLKKPADSSKPGTAMLSDDKVIAMMKDRSYKVKTQKPFEPSGKFGSFEETLNEFNNKRDAHIEYVKTTDDDLRNRFQEMPFGTIDAFQILLFMSGHTERHVQQMQEVMDDPNFPME